MKKLGYVKRWYFYTLLRLAITGKNEGPPLADIMVYLGKAETLRRIRKYL